HREWSRHPRNEWDFAFLHNLGQNRTWRPRKIKLRERLPLILGFNRTLGPFGRQTIDRPSR
ncbi:MAG: hypothetical protein WBM25_02425, partial [Azonexus sp.]